MARYKNILWSLPEDLKKFKLTHAVISLLMDMRDELRDLNEELRRSFIRKKVNKKK